jgi:hypothetical protein
MSAHRYLVLCFAFCLGIGGATGHLSAEEASNGNSAVAEDRIDFTLEIRPILSNKCFQCHGPDEGSRESELRLDAKAELFKDLGGHQAVVPGKPEESELLRRVTSDEDYERMPPIDSDYPPLTPAEIDVLRRWIEQGAEWEEHWAFVAPSRPDLPQTQEVNGRSWGVNEIDAFTLSRMQQKGFEPAAEASKERLLRRVTLDLTGLPPTLKEIDEFLADESPDAYERVVDRLLKSARYGEQMTRDWLDVARYGDTHGLHLDNVRSIWKYRDWLIEAFNANQPFDQMTIEQVAGDLLPEPSIDQRVATGFNRCNVSTSEGGSIEEEVHVRNTVDRVETFSTVYLGLTMGCAVCHDHKFDPITQEEFYGLYAYFNSLEPNGMDGNALLHPPFVEVPTAEQAARRTELQTQIAAVKERIRLAIDTLEYTDPQPDYDPESVSPADYVWIDDDVPSGANLQTDGHDWEWVSEPVHSGERAMKRTVDALGQHFFTGATPPLILGQGDRFFAHVYLDPENPPSAIMLQFNDGTWEHRAYWGTAQIPFGNHGQPSKRKIDVLPQTGEWVRLEVPIDKVGLKPGAKVHGWAFTQFGGTVYWDQSGLTTRTPQGGQTFKSQRLWEVATADGSGLPKPVQEAIKVAPAERNEQQQQTVRQYFLENIYVEAQQTLQPLTEQRTALETELTQLNEAIPKTMVSEEMAEPRQAFFLNRGEYDNKGEPVDRHLPAALPPMPADAPQNRLGLAQWLVDPSHPLMSRVTVNRWWQRYFGTGLVKTSEDFGIQAEPPSHPELLDWLAVEFIESSWDVKHMQKLIVMSATYRQSSPVSAEARRRDPGNRWLARGPRFRMPAELIRDQALFVSGLLVEKLGGPSVKPYQPDGLWEAVGYTDSNTANFAQDDGVNLYRRSMYTFWKRTSPPPSMATFDAPSRETCTVRRPRTNTPLQALVLMNDKQFVETARHFAQRILAEAPSSESERLEWAFRVITSRRPDQSEMAVLQQVLEQHQSDFAADPQRATALIDSATTQINPDHLDRDKSHDPQLAAWTLVASLLLNLDETVTKG